MEVVSGIHIVSNSCTWHWNTEYFLYIFFVYLVSSFTRFRYRCCVSTTLRICFDCVTIFFQNNACVRIMLLNNQYSEDKKHHVLWYPCWLQQVILTVVEQRHFLSSDDRGMRNDGSMLAYSDYSGPYASSMGGSNMRQMNKQMGGSARMKMPVRSMETAFAKHTGNVRTSRAKETKAPTCDREFKIWLCLLIWHKSTRVRRIKIWTENAFCTSRQNIKQFWWKHSCRLSNYVQHPHVFMKTFEINASGTIAIIFQGNTDFSAKPGGPAYLSIL